MLVLEVGDPDAGFEEIGPVVAVEALLAQAVVERFDETVVPWRARWDVGDPDFAWTSLPDCPDDVNVAGCAVLADGRRVMFSQDIMVVDLEPRLRDVASLVLGHSAFDCGDKDVH